MQKHQIICMQTLNYLDANIKLFGCKHQIIWMQKHQIIWMQTSNYLDAKTSII